MNQDSSSAAIVEAFQQAVAGLYFPSESDYPFEVRLWQGEEGTPLTLATLLPIWGRDPNGPVQTLDGPAFFAPLTQERDWHGEVETARVQQFRSLAERIDATLSNVQVYRLGRIEIDIYVVGKIRSSANDWIILATKAIET